MRANAALDRRRTGRVCGGLGGIDSEGDGDDVEFRPITARLAMGAAGVPLASHVVASEGTQHVFYASQDDGHIHEYWWRSGQVGAVTSCPPAARHPGQDL
jgi:hypothetical protein